MTALSRKSSEGTLPAAAWSQRPACRPSLQHTGTVAAVLLQGTAALPMPSEATAATRCIDRPRPLRGWRRRHPTDHDALAPTVPSTEDSTQVKEREDTMHLAVARISRQDIPQGRQRHSCGGGPRRPRAARVPRPRLLRAPAVRTRAQPRKMLGESIQRHGIKPGTLTVHSDRGSPMKAGTTT